MVGGVEIEASAPNGSPADVRFVSSLRAFADDATGRTARLVLFSGAMMGLSVLGLIVGVMGAGQFGPVVWLLLGPAWLAGVGSASFHFLTDRVLRIGRTSGVVERHFFWRVQGASASDRPLLCRRIDPSRWRYAVPLHMRLSGSGVSREFFQVFAAQRLGRGWRRGAMLVFATPWGWGANAGNRQLAILDRIGESAGWEVRMDPLSK